MGPPVRDVNSRKGLMEPQMQECRDLASYRGKKLSLPEIASNHHNATTDANTRTLTVICAHRGSRCHQAFMRFTAVAS